MRTHIQRTVSCCFAVLRQLQQIRRLIPTVRGVPDTGGSVSSVATGLRQWRNDRPPYLPCTLTPIGASAQMIFQLRRSDHITDVLASLHWLRLPERIQFKIAMLTYKVLHGTAPRYLGPLVHVSDLLGRCRLRSASTNRLVVPSFKLSTIGSRTFNVAAARTWNGLPEDVTSSPTLPTFRKI